MSVYATFSVLVAFSWPFQRSDRRRRGRLGSAARSAGTRLTRQRVGTIVREAAQEATRRHESRGLPPLPHITPHSLRRTYISIALIANNFDVK